MSSRLASLEQLEKSKQYLDVLEQLEEILIMLDNDPEIEQELYKKRKYVQEKYKNEILYILSEGKEHLRKISQKS